MRNAELLPFDRAFLTKAAAAVGFPLTPEQTDRLAAYYDFLTEYNQKVNLTAVTDPHGVAVTHFADSLTLLRADLPKGARIADIGAGAGFPSVPVAVYRPDLSWTLIDSLGKRVTFLRQLSEKIGVPYEALHLRAEEAGRQARLREQFDAGCARGVARLYLLCEYALPLLKVGGRLIAMKGPDPQEEIAQAAYAAEKLGGAFERVDTFSLPDGSGRSLVIFQKTSTTPAQFPRVSAKIAKNPLILP